MIGDVAAGNRLAVGEHHDGDRRHVAGTIYAVRGGEDDALVEEDARAKVFVRWIVGRIVRLDANDAFRDFG